MMVEILCSLLALLLYFAIIALHEWAHADAMLRAGIDVAEVAIGFGPKLYSRVLAGGTRLSLRLVPLGGYTRARSERSFTSLSTRDRVRIDGAGVFANLATGLVGTGVAAALYGRPWQVDAGLSAAGVVVWAMRRELAPGTLLVAPLGFAAVVWLILYQHPASGTPAVHASPLSGPLGLVELMIVRSPVDAISISSGLSLSIAVLNALPFVPLDGGNIARRWITSHVGLRASRAFDAGTTALLTLLLIGGVLNDVLTLVWR
jgi:membrane-associated protease RseP (regulator of RpoE activity)